jgi:hypothetical protein
MGAVRLCFLEMCPEMDLVHLLLKINEQREFVE